MWRFSYDTVIIGAQKSAQFSRTGLCQHDEFEAYFSIQVFFEQGLLAIIGCAVGFAVGCAVVKVSADGLMIGGVSAICGLAGSVASAVRVCRADPLTLMKAKE